MANNIIIVTSYPEQGSVHSARTVGVASYTKQLLQGILKVDESTQIRVLAERFADQTSYLEDGMKIDRLWKRGSLWDILKMWIILVRSNEKVIVLSFEAYMFGNLLYSFIALWLMSTLRYFGKKTVVLMHQVPQELSFVKGVRKIITKIGIGILKMVLDKVDTVIVFEEALRNRIGNNAVFVPHFVPELLPTKQSEARRVMGLSSDKQIVLYFGYIAPYKGLERLIELWSSTSTVQLVIAGGINPNHKDKKEIQEYVDKILKLARRKNIVTTGFVPEDKISTYFSACDAVILPYTEFMSSSGPMSLAWAYGKAVILSNTLKDYLKSSDIAHGLEEAGLMEVDLFYNSNESDLKRVLEKLPKLKVNFGKLAEYMQSKRSMASVSLTISQILWSKK